ncbi:MAG: serine hydrolase [Bacteroidales bacterium]|nr:serine hydrolase [Bacteroidales bacterium]
MKKTLLIIAAALAAACTGPRELPRASASPELEAAFQTFIDSSKVIDSLHSIMIVKDGAVVGEHFFGEWTPDKPHPMFSVSKTFTSSAVGMAIAEGKMSLGDRVSDYFPDKTLPDNPCEATVKDLLTMSCGQAKEATYSVLHRDNGQMVAYLGEGVDCQGAFFAEPFVYEPGTRFVYNSLGTYMLSAMLTKATGESVLDYLTPRLFEPLGIEKPEWEADCNGISAGGWGLWLKTEDLAKMGLLLLQKGKWHGKQLIPADWVEQMGSKQISTGPEGSPSNWAYGYGFQTWRNKTEGFRADGAGGQFILVLPSKNAAVIITAWTATTQLELDLVWDLIYPYL